MLPYNQHHALKQNGDDGKKKIESDGTFVVVSLSTFF